MVFKFSGCLVKEKINYKSLLSSLKTVTNSKNVPKAASEFMFLLSFAVIGQFSVQYMSLPAFGTIFFIGGLRNNF